MKNFNEIARKSVTLADIMENREKIDTETLIEKYPNGFVIDELEYISMTKDGQTEDQFWVFHIAETNNFAFAGFVLGKIFNDFLAAYGGDFETLYKEFKESGGIKVRLSTAYSKSNHRAFTTVSIIQ